MVACAATDGGTITYSSRAVGDYVVYYARAPYDGFPDLPVDYAWVDSYFMGTKDELYEQMELTKNGVKFYVKDREIGVRQDTQSITNSALNR